MRSEVQHLSKCLWGDAQRPGRGAFQQVLCMHCPEKCLACLQRLCMGRSVAHDQSMLRMARGVCSVCMLPQDCQYA